MEISELVDRCKELGEIYRRAAVLLSSAELRAYLLHEAEWLLHQRSAGTVAEVVADRIRQAADYLAALEAMHPGRRQAGLRVVK